MRAAVNQLRLGMSTTFLWYRY